MGDAEKETDQKVLATPPPPTAQPDNAEPAPEPAAAEPAAEQTTTSREEKLEQARKFLQDAQVQNTTPERKAEFLKSKGLAEGDIEALLKEVSHDGRPEIKEERIEPPLAKEDRPPIVTYPEFLTKPARPPPLVTVNRFLNTLYAFGGLSALVYGTSKYVVEPMVHTLTEARISLHDTANQDLGKLVSKLEATVSELPPPKPTTAKAAAAKTPSTNDDAASSYDDPTELFHRDIGVQTSLPSSPNLHTRQPSSTAKENPTIKHTQTIARLAISLKSLSEGVVDHTESLGDVQTVVDQLKADLDRLSAAAATDFVGGFSLYGAASKNEPDDEIKRAKENIRRVKGVLLSTRSFPATR
ncbi:peroxisomal membrane anchor protein conserved region-domain-containing protein [Staphylotrichum tortipilum]|uniref:Peroxisomal membrane protein PEX14 n=1 Tax=Staphylotrichum tortipilum TaxID=2831512 RepID=A0AAN6MKN3_9PEZI|nr:peroxisomal membrane anchor protein conserved region-domain-containing protein [Staphylotrichum longicolle]